MSRDLRPAEPGLRPLPFARWPVSLRPGRSHPMLVALLLPVAVFLFSLPNAVNSHKALAFPFTFAMVLPLLWRRRAPEWVFVILTAVAALQMALDVPLTADAALLVAFYAVVLTGTGRWIVGTAAVMEGGVVFSALRWASAQWLLGLVLLTGMVTAAGVLGFNVRIRRAYLSGLEDRADRLERERDTQVQLAQAAERTRVARELHDIVAHHVTVMITLAEGSAALARTQPDRAVEAMTTVSATGRQALAETRGLLGVLRSADTEADARAPQPDLSALDALLQQLRAAGLATSLTVSGERAGLSAGLELTVFRIVQEALTNALKHGGPAATASVDLRYEPDAVSVTVTDDGLGAADVEHELTGGNGLVGMRERVEFYGGTMHAGPVPGSGWRVSAVLPLVETTSAVEQR